MDTVTVLELVKDSIAADHNEILFVTLDSEGCNVGIGHNNTRVAIKSVKFRLDVAKGTTDGQSTREDTMRSQDYLALDSARLLDIYN